MCSDSFFILFPPVWKERPKPLFVLARCEDEAEATCDPSIYPQDKISIKCAKPSFEQTIRPVGVEPTTVSLKGSCSTTELRAVGKHKNYNRFLCFEKIITSTKRFHPN